MTVKTFTWYNIFDVLFCRTSDASTSKGSLIKYEHIHYYFFGIETTGTEKLNMCHVCIDVVLTEIERGRKRRENKEGSWCRVIESIAINGWMND